ncbi:hypothetical protein I0C86_40500 [Plantactinospora sp. S1510]|uniref:Uncharacterized protein n=1 Tax=Plantactinospora alkalitolerans TaxID=2789879 RepID=A0ABS0HAN6_9ACTN|nr:hypothetical protein [Plantactinospora alkalitolerans]MBF9135162.1 hypothetical protein [Plantactinospora alkalitolerans]
MPEVPAGTRGPWFAILANPEGEQRNYLDMQHGDEVWILLVRGKAAPKGRGDVPRVTRSTPITDVLVNDQDLVFGTDAVQARWDQVRQIAAALNAQSGQPDPDDRKR